MTSDAFFSINRNTYDIIFIDGLHLCDQVLRDVDNSLYCLNKGGIIIMHDCLPKRESDQIVTVTPPPGTGDVWKAAAYIRMHYKDVYFCVLDMDYGCGILMPNFSQDLFPCIPIEEMDWNFYQNNRKSLLNVMRVEDWLS